MKHYLERLVLKIDALSLRERAIIFVMAALVVVVMVNSLLLDPQYSQQKQLSERIRRDQAATAAMQAEIRQKALAQQTDPDQANKLRLQQLQQDFAQKQAALGSVQEGLVSPDKMPALLEDILKRNSGLRLVSLATLPTAPLADPAPGAVYRHAVELVLRGPYLDIMNTLAQLESMPWQLFWSKANLNVDGYPDATLTLTLFTLSTDGKWLKL